jgi:hypothetical protein
MAQPGGLICNADADVGFLLRSSPIICISDALLVLIHLTIDHRQTKSWKKAHKKLICRRFQSYVYDGWKKLKGSKDEPVRSNEWYLRLVVFVLTLAQSIKIFAYGGVIWTKVIAALYLGSFLIIEALVVWPVSKMKAIPDTEKSDSPVETYTSVAVAVAFMLWFTSVAFKDVLGQPHHTLPQWSAIVIGTLGTIMAVPALGYSFRHAPSCRTLMRAAALLLLVLGAPVGFYFVGHAFRDNAPLILVQVVCAILSVVWGSIALIYAVETTRTIRRTGMEEQRKKVEQVTAWYFFLLHLMTGLLYYIFSYNASNTVRPAWTECLG